jgi:hypothetical protein
MKKFIILTFVVIAMMTATHVQAQSLSVSPYACVPLDQNGPVSTTDLGAGITALVGVGGDIASFGLDFNGGIQYNDFSDSVVRSTNIPAIQFVGTLNLPPGEEGSNHWAGPIFGMAYGPGFRQGDHMPVGDFKIFLQANYGGPVGKVNLSGFFQVGFSYLGTSPQMYNWPMSLGLRITIPYAFSPGQE